MEESDMFEADFLSRLHDNGSTVGGGTDQKGFCSKCGCETAGTKKCNLCDIVHVLWHGDRLWKEVCSDEPSTENHKNFMKMRDKLQSGQVEIPEGWRATPIQQVLQDKETIITKTPCGCIPAHSREAYKQAYGRDPVDDGIEPCSFELPQGGTMQAFKANVVAVKKKWIDLSKQNLLFHPEVKACLKVLPNITPGNIWDSELLDELAKANNLGIFQSEVVEAVISAAWEQMRAYTALDIGARLLTVIALSYTSFAFRTEGMLSESMLSLLLAAGLHFKQSVEELCQHLTGALMYALRGKHYSVLDFDTVFDLSYLVAGWIAIGRQLWTQNLEKNFMPLYCGMSWLRVLWALRGECWMGPGLLPILYALKDTMAFFIVTITSLLAATHAYYNLQIQDTPSPFYGSFVTVVRLGIFGDFDLLDLEGISSTSIFQEDAGGYVSVSPDPGPNYTAVHCLFYIIGMGIAVLLMNLLIGVLGKNFDMYQDQSNILYLRARSKMLRDIRNRPWQYMSCLRRSKCKEEVSAVDLSLLAPVTVSCWPLYPVLRRRFALMIANVRGLAKRYYGIALLLCILSPVVLMLSTGFLFVWFVGGMFLSWSGMSHTLATTLGCAYESSQIPMIWCIARETQSENDTSMRWYLKAHFKKIEDKMEAMDARIDLLVRPMPNAGDVPRVSSGLCPMQEPHSCTLQRT